MDQKKLPRECWYLKRWLEEHFVSGRFYTIEELCDNVVDNIGRKLFKYNTDLRNHDKSIQLSNAIRKINWSITDGYKIIIKDSKGSAKLCESEQEFNEWKEKEMKRLLPKWQYLNNLTWKAERDGTIPIYNQAMNENKDNKVVKVYQKERVVKTGKYAGMTLSELISAGMCESLNNGGDNE